MKVFLRGEEGQLFEAVFPPLPYDPSPPFHVAKGETPLETPAGVLGVATPKQRCGGVMGHREEGNYLL